MNVIIALVDLRPDPSGEVFVIELDDGHEVDLCPVRWDGAERIYALVARAIRRGERRRRRELARARRRARPNPGASASGTIVPSSSTSGPIGPTIPPV